MDVFQWCIVVLILIVYKISITSAAGANEKLEATFKLLEQGETNTKINNGLEQVILIVGRSGVGKTPFAKWLTINNTLLMSEQLDEGGPFLMIDTDGKIGTSITQSATIFPDLYQKEGVYYCDFPGFRDTRGVSFGLATTYFIKKVVDNARSVKILLMVDYDSVKLGGSRDGFTTILNEFNDFIKDIDKFRDSVAMIVTKVPRLSNDDDSDDDGPRYLSDDEIISGIGKFMKKVRGELSNNTINANANNKKKEKAVEIIDILLENNLSRIGVFRYPNRRARFSELKLLHPGKDRIEKIISSELVFTDSTANDFGYTISDESKIEVGELLDEIIRNKLVIYMSNVCVGIKEFYAKQLTMEVGNIVTLNFTVMIGLWQFQEIKSEDPREFLKSLLRAVKVLKIETSNDDLTHIDNHIKYIDFLTNVENKTLTIPAQFATSLNNVTDYISSEYKILVDKLIDKLYLNDFPADVAGVCNEIERYYARLEKTIPDLNILKDQFALGHKILTAIGTNVGPQLFSKLLVSAVNELEIGADLDVLNAITKHSNELDFLTIVKNEKFSKDSHNFINKLDTIINRLDNARKWYNFLIALNDKLSEKNLPGNIVNISTQITTESNKQKNVSDIGLKRLLVNIDEVNLLSEVENMRVNSVQLEALKRVLDYSTEKPKISCLTKQSATRMEIKGNIIKISDIIRDKECWQMATIFEIFALDTVVIDASIDKTGKQAQMTIIAPKWRILGENTIALNGEHGKNMADENAENGDQRGAPQSGKDGKRGLPGGPGGNFFGIGAQFVNGHMLKIQSNGGNGGRGQNGGIGRYFFLISKLVNNGI